jgi:hypothetical protein
VPAFQRYANTLVDQMTKDAVKTDDASGSFSRSLL